MLTALFVGLGSIGTRHLKNLKQLAPGGVAVHALRSDLSRPLRDGVEPLLDRQFTSLSEGQEHYDIAFITNPTSLHAETLLQLKGRADTLFIEKPMPSFCRRGKRLTWRRPCAGAP